MPSISSSASSAAEAVEPKGLRLFLPLCVAFVARLLALPFAHISHPTLWEYGTIARCMLAGQGYSVIWRGLGVVSKPYPTAFMPPGETMIQFAGMWLLGDNVHGYIVIFVLHALCGVGLFIFPERSLRRYFTTHG